MFWAKKQNRQERFVLAVKQSGWWDLNPRPRRPERRALAGLRYIPNVLGDYNVPKHLWQGWEFAKIRMTPI